MRLLAGVMSPLWAAVSLRMSSCMEQRSYLRKSTPQEAYICGVLLLVAEAAFVTAAGLGAGAGVDAELEALGVDVVAEGLHVGEAVVGVEDALGVALALPGVVEVDVDVAGVLHAGGDELVGGAADVGVGDVVGEVVPTVPAHRRGLLGGFLLGVERRAKKDERTNFNRDPLIHFPPLAHC